MSYKELLEQLIKVSETLLSKRYRDGECDGVALVIFEDELEDIKEKLASLIDEGA